jgi:predicted alpha/beta hydrolase family esterase
MRSWGTLSQWRPQLPLPNDLRLANLKKRRVLTCHCRAMANLTIVFSHGKESGPEGGKILHLMETAHGHCSCQTLSVDYRGIRSPDDRAKHLTETLEGLRDEIVLVGSSMGGYVSTVASCSVPVLGLFLMAPAFYLGGKYQVTRPSTTCGNISIVHGRLDEVVSFESSVEFAREFGARLKLVDDGHRLKESYEDLDEALRELIDAALVSAA